MPIDYKHRQPLAMGGNRLINVTDRMGSCSVTHPGAFAFTRGPDRDPRGVNRSADPPVVFPPRVFPETLLGLSEIVFPEKFPGNGWYGG